MRLVDFEYAGERLSDYASILCHLTDSTDMGAVSVGAELTYNTVTNGNNFKRYKTSIQHGEPYSIPLQICKNPCNINEIQDSYFTDLEMNKIIRWLNRESYHILRPIYDDGSYYDVYFKGYFNIQPIVLNGNIVGAELTFISNSPYASSDIENEFEIEPDETIMFSGDSDKDGYSYMDITIECLESGDLEIKNSADNKITKIANCESGEIITLNGEEKIIQSSLEHKKLFNDFNYCYPRIFSKYDEVDNEFSFSLPCNVIANYSVARKVGII